MRNSNLKRVEESNNDEAILARAYTLKKINLITIYYGMQIAAILIQNLNAFATLIVMLQLDSDLPCLMG